MGDTIPKIRNYDRRWEYFGLGDEDEVTHRYETVADTGKYSDGGGMGAVGSYSMAAARNLDGRLEVFTTNPSNELIHAYQSVAGGGWNGWEVLATGVRDRQATR